MVDSVATGQRIAIVTPAERSSRSGNRVTALRWAGLLRSLGHHVRIDRSWTNRPADVLVAVHAVKSAAAVLAAKRTNPIIRTVVLLAGTDIYPRFDPDATTLSAMEAADALVALQPLASAATPERFRAKSHTIVQSATAVATPRTSAFTAVVLAHLRRVKEPLLAVEAVAATPPSLAIELRVAGRRLEADYADEFCQQVAATPRARWLGELSRIASKRLLASSHVCIVPSSAEGGANVVSEAIAAGTPLLCSDIPGNLGLLGADWPGAFPAGDSDALAARLEQVATDRAFSDDLAQRTRALQPMVAPAHERAQWQQLLEWLDRRN